MEYNTIKSLSKGIGNLKSLKTLVLTGNQLESLPEWVCKLENLELLTLSGNPITRLPKNIHKLKNLKSLIALDTKMSNQEKERIKKALPACKIML